MSLAELGSQDLGWGTWTLDVREEGTQVGWGQGAWETGCLLPSSDSKRSSQPRLQYPLPYQYGLFDVRSASSDQQVGTADSGWLATDSRGSRKSVKAVNMCVSVLNAIY